MKQNSENNFSKKMALQILNSGFEAADPENFLKKYIKKQRIQTKNRNYSLQKYKNVHIVSFGKAADSMAKVVNSLTKIKSGFIVIPKGSKSLIEGKKFRIFQSGHPIPNKNSVLAAKSIMQFLHTVPSNDFVIFLVSGGGSSLLSLPNKITLSQKKFFTDYMIKSGATIQEINCIRKHLSCIKGGQMISEMKSKGISLVMSDVFDDDLSSIASGTTYCDPTTFQDSLKIIKKYKLKSKLPKKIIQILESGVKGKIPETPKKSKIPNIIVANNMSCIKEMEKNCKLLGIKTRSIRISGTVVDSAKKLSKLAPKYKKSCLLFGGEPTVKVTGRGKGGRNQELVLRLLKNLQNASQNYVIASLGTDGIDGNTKYAGAITKNKKIKSHEIEKFLKNNDSNSFFKTHNGLIKTGFTHTNLQDIGLILHI